MVTEQMISKRCILISTTRVVAVDRCIDRQGMSPSPPCTPPPLLSTPGFGGRHLQSTFGRSRAYAHRDREFFIDNLLVRIHLIIEMILVDRPCAMGV